jgi:hypothetical protein
VISEAASKAAVSTPPAATHLSLPTMPWRINWQGVIGLAVMALSAGFVAGWIYTLARLMGLARDRHRCSHRHSLHHHFSHRRPVVVAAGVLVLLVGAAGIWHVIHNRRMQQ